jgi:hypothetical protein
VIFRELHLWRNYDGGFYGKLWLHIAKHNLRRRDLHWRKVGQSSLRCRRRITISAATTASYNLLRSFKYIRIRGRRYESHELSLLGLLHSLMSDGSARKDKA